MYWCLMLSLKHKEYMNFPGGAAASRCLQLVFSWFDSISSHLYPFVSWPVGVSPLVSHVPILVPDFMGEITWAGIDVWIQFRFPARDLVEPAKEGTRIPEVRVKNVQRIQKVVDGYRWRWSSLPYDAWTSYDTWEWEDVSQECYWATIAVRKIEISFSKWFWFNCVFILWLFWSTRSGHQSFEP